MRFVILATAAIASAGTSAVTADAWAARRYDVVVAHSRFNNGSITAPVRIAAYGYQVRLPNGAWVKCRRSCSETLRVETVDLHEALNPNTAELAAECGVLGCLELRWPR